MELRIFFRCDKVIDKQTKQTLWRGPSEIQLATLPIYPSDILYSRPKLSFLKRLITLKLQEEYFVKRLTPPDHHVKMYRCKMGYEDYLSHIHGISRVDLETPSNNLESLILHDEDGRYAELCITITLAIQNNGKL